MIEQIAIAGLKYVNMMWIGLMLGMLFVAPLMIILSKMIKIRWEESE